ncbi:Alpha/Beta hydrolase protein [Halenospora varia]|nr:Alpha/Beta hydrolase protein [Halenospora varia]
MTASLHYQNLAIQDMHIHRIGFTELTGTGNARNGPILFVHGLRGHPRHTWEDSRDVGSDDPGPATSSKRKVISYFKHKSSASTANNRTSKDSSAKVFWPNEYLIQDIPEARIWTYGYNADVIGGLFQADNQNSVSQHGRDLAVRVEREIENEDPIIFVVHSLGGIIAKDAIRRSETCRARTKLIVFLGTPHRGSTYAGWGEIVSNLARLAMQDSNKEIIKTLEVNSEILDNIHEEFKTIVDRSRIKIHSFQEARGISGMKGLHNKVDYDFSSKLDLPRPLETVESIDANHMQMARCSDRADPRYRAIAGVLKQFMRNMVFIGDESRPQEMELTASSTETQTATTTVEVDRASTS